MEQTGLENHGASALLVAVVVKSDFGYFLVIFLLIVSKSLTFHFGLLCEDRRNETQWSIKSIQNETQTRIVVNI